MKVRDEEAWQERCAELSVDRTGRIFRAFLEYWAEKAENLMWEGTGGQRDPVPWMNPADALNMGLCLAEEHFGRCGAHFLGQMIAVLAEHWEHGEELMQGLTPFERRVVEDLTLLKIAQEQEKATAVAGTNGES